MINNALILDIEILRAVPTREARIDGIEYCRDWNDHYGMGVACIGAYDYAANAWLMFTKETMTYEPSPGVLSHTSDFERFAYLVQRRFPLVGHNLIPFDLKVLEACGVINHAVLNEDCYDTLRELWLAAGLAPTWRGQSHWGFSLDSCGLANFGLRKTGDGAHAPIWWQRGDYARVFSYCLNDILLTKKLFERMAIDGYSLDPRDPDRKLITRKLVTEAL